MVKPDWTSVEAYSEFPPGELTIGRTGDVPPDMPKLTPQQAASELFRRRRESHDERMAERMAILSDRALRLQAMEQQLWELTSCSPGRTDLLRVGTVRHVRAWQLWAFVAAPVVIGLLGIAVGLSMGRW